MDQIEWAEHLSVRVKDIDKQHKKLIALINRLNRARMEGTVSNRVLHALDEMIDYLQYHFAKEEHYMVRYDYPGYRTHRGEHRIFVEKTLEFSKSFREGSESLPDDILHFLKDWLINHILKTDAKFGPYLNEKGVVLQDEVREGARGKTTEHNRPERKYFASKRR